MWSLDPTLGEPNRHLGPQSELSSDDKTAFLVGKAVFSIQNHSLQDLRECDSSRTSDQGRALWQVLVEEAPLRVVCWRSHSRWKGKAVGSTHLF